MGPGKLRTKHDGLEDGGPPPGKLRTNVDEKLNREAEATGPVTSH